MTDLDLERLGDVWRQQPDPAELERLQRTARAVRRRARLQQFVDVAAAVVVASVVLLFVISSGRLETVVMGSAAILVLLVSNIRLRRLRAVELKDLTGSTEQMLDQSIERLESTLKYQRFSLVAIGPALVLGYLLAWSTDTSGDLLDRAWTGLRSLGSVWSAGWVVIFAAIALYVVFGIRRSRRELQRLTALREAYRQEEE